MNLMINSRLNRGNEIALYVDAFLFNVEMSHVMIGRDLA